jgi:hypothetical protein
MVNLDLSTETKSQDPIADDAGQPDSTQSVVTLSLLGRGGIKAVGTPVCIQCLCMLDGTTEPSAICSLLIITERRASVG